MQQLGINDIADLTKVVPNVDMYGGNGTSGAGKVFIRGIGARNTGTNFDSGVGNYKQLDSKATVNIPSKTTTM
jgi:iron complex outermembrane receptor protein